MHAKVPEIVVLEVTIIQAKDENMSIHEDRNWFGGNFSLYWVSRGSNANLLFYLFPFSILSCFCFAEKIQ